MKIRTIERNLVIRLPKEEDKTEGGIIKPEAVKAGRVVNRGVVVAVGPKVTDAAVGDTVVFSPHSLTRPLTMRELKDENDLVVISEEHVLAVFPQAELDAKAAADAKAEADGAASIAAERSALRVPLI